MQRYWILCWLTCISLLTGCASMQSLPQKPEVTLAGVELIEAGIFEQTFNIKLRIHNPNNIDLPLDGITIKLTLNQQPFATASSTQTLTIPRLSSRVVDVAAISTLANIGQQIGGLFSKEKNGMHYQLQGQIHLIKPVISVPIDQQGEINLGKLLPKL